MYCISGPRRLSSGSLGRRLRGAVAELRCHQEESLRARPCPSAIAACTKLEARRSPRVPEPGRDAPIIKEHASLQVHRADAEERERLRERERAVSPVSACNRVFVEALDAVDHLSPPLVALTLVRRRGMAVRCGHGWKLVSFGSSSTQLQPLVGQGRAASEGGH